MAQSQGKKPDKRTISEVYTLEDLFFVPLERLIGLIHWVQKHVFGVKHVTGNEAFIGQRVTVTDIDESGTCFVMIEGERWKLTCEDDLVVGDEAKITDVQGLNLVVEKK